MRREPIIPCGLSSGKKERIDQFVHLLEKERPEIDTTPITEQEFWAAIERLRGTRAATMTDKRAFMKAVLDHLMSLGHIRAWRFAGTGERHDYEATLSDGRTSIIETKGCLDGNNTNIFERPPQADEFLIWSLCQNAGADPDKKRMVRYSNSAECRDNSPTAKGGWRGDLGLALRKLTYLSEGYRRPKPVNSRRRNETAAALSLSPSANTARSTEQSYPGLLEARGDWSYARALGGIQG